MKKLMGRVVAIGLSLGLLFSMIPAGVLAANEAETKEAVEVAEEEAKGDEEAVEVAEGEAKGDEEAASEEEKPEYTREELWCYDDEGDIFGEIYYPADFDETKTYPVVVASHGYGVKGDFFSIMWAPELAKEGYIVYAHDFRGGSPAESFAGASRSEGDWLEMSVLTEVHDLNEVIDFVKTLAYVDTEQIFLIGQSQGGLVTALTAAEREENGENDIAGAILLYPYLNVADDIRAKYEKKEDLPEKSAPWLNDWVVGRKYYEDLYEVNIFEEIAGYTGNVLLVQGIADVTVPYTNAIRAMEESYAHQAAQLLLVAGDNAEHTFELFAYPKGRDMAVAAVKTSLENWRKWIEEEKKQAEENDRPENQQPVYTSDVMVAQNVSYLADDSDFHKLDVYDSVGADTVQPLVIEIHGGGLIGGTKETNLMHSDYYAKNGFKVVTPNYTLMPNGNYKTIVQDLFAMFNWVAQNADVYHYDLNNVFLSGDSAGGYIVTLLATVLHTPALQEYYEVTVPEGIQFKGFVLTCPMADQEDLVRALDGEQKNFLNGMIFAPRIGETILRDKDVMDHAILFNIIDPATFPEVYIITTSDGGDPYYRDAVMLKDFLDQNNLSYVYNDYHKVENDLGHVFNINNDKIEWVESVQANNDAIAYMLGLCK